MIHERPTILGSYPAGYTGRIHVARRMSLPTRLTIDGDPYTVLAGENPNANYVTLNRSLQKPLTFDSQVIIQEN